ncbi:MAG: M56 family metallopeptidase, partial [Gemmatimonadota bacterium]
MIAYALLYSVAVGVPVLLAAWSLAAVLRRHGRAERWVWLSGLVLAFALPVVGLLQGSMVAGNPGAGSPAAGPTTGVIGLPEIVVFTGDAAKGGAASVLVFLWAAASLLLGLRLAVAALRLARAGRSWRRDTMDDVPVWLTDDLGPAVSGLVRPRVLVPGWLADMPADKRSLVLLHEQEHIRAGDPWLMVVSRIAPILTPWHPVVWMISARLLRAIELDCDRRVLRRRPDVRTYGRTLIEISARDRGRLVAVAAFAESEAPLRSRILNMTTPSRAVSVAALMVSLVFGVLLIVAAFEIPVPAIRAELSFGSADTDVPAVEPPRQVVSNGAGVRRPTEPVVSESQVAIDAAAAEYQRVRREVQRARIGSAQARGDLRDAADRAVESLDQRLVEAERRLAAAEYEASLPIARRVGRIREDIDPEAGLDPAPRADLSAQPTFTPFTSPPRLLNLTDVQEALTREYP